MRVWRWSERDRATLGTDDPSRVRTARDARRSERGLDEPGLCLVDASDRPLVALGRFPCVRDDRGVLDDGVLVPDASGAWRRVGLATTTPDRQVIRDEAGTIRAVRTWPDLRAMPVDARERMTVGARTWHLADVTRRGQGLIAWLAPIEFVALRFSDGANVALEARRHDHRAWDGDVTATLVLDAKIDLDPWTLAAFALVLLTTIDASDGGHRD